MPRYEIEVEFLSKKTITVTASDEEDAETRATDIVTKWENVLDVTEVTVLS